MKKIANIFNLFVTPVFLMGLFVSLIIVSTLDIMLGLQITGSFFKFLIGNNIFSMDSINSFQEFALQDNQRKYWFLFLTNIGAILSCYAFFISLRSKKQTGSGTGAKKIIYLGLLIVFVSGSIDSVFGFKGIANLQTSAEVSKITLLSGEVKNIPFKIKFKSVVDTEEETYAELAITKDDETKNIKLSPWEPTYSGLYTMNYYAIQNSKPMVTFYAKSLINTLREPSLLGVQVGRKIENKQENISFRIVRINPPKANIYSNSNDITGFKNEGRSIDYLLEYEGKNIALRTFEYYPNIMAMNNGNGKFILVPFGLSVVNKTGWAVLKEYLKYTKNNPKKSEKYIFKKLNSLNKYDDNVQKIIQAKVVKAASVIKLLNLPYLLQMENIYPLKQITMRIYYEPSLYASCIGIFLLIAGLFVSLIFSRRKKI